MVKFESNDGNDVGMKRRFRIRCDRLSWVSKAQSHKIPTNVNLFDGFRDSDSFLGDSLFKGVKVADDDVNVVVATSFHIGIVGRNVAGQDA